MLFEAISQVLIRYWPAVVVLLAVTWLAKQKFNNGLHKYPGPALAAFTDFWRFFVVLGRKAHDNNYALHKKYGDVVRIGPNFLLFSSPEAVNDIYGLKKGFVKTEFYQVQNAISHGERIQSLFSTMDENYHARFRRCVNSAFAMSTLVSYEPLVDSTTQAFLEQTQKRFAATGESCDFARWLQFYAFDVIGEITWSQRLGFVERNEDVEGIIESVAKTVEYAAPIGQVPWLDSLFLDKNPLKMLLGRLNLWNATSPIAQFAADRAKERTDELKLSQAAESSKDLDSINTDAHADVEKGTDFLTRFRASQRAHPDFMTDFQILTATVSLVFAGSDTTGTTLSAIFYLLLRHPHALAALRAELDAAAASGLIPAAAPTVTWAASQKLPYLDAVIQETFRLYPAIALPPERHVPAGGATIAGHAVPGGTIVGCNAFVLHRNERIFGADALAFRPERWLEAAPARLKEMKGAMFQFGAGARTCIGRHISTLEIYKLVPSVLRRFDIEFVDPAKEWDLVNCWFIKVEGFNVRFRERVGAEAAERS